MRSRDDGRSVIVLAGGDIGLQPFANLMQQRELPVALAAGITHHQMKLQ